LPQGADGGGNHNRRRCGVACHRAYPKTAGLARFALCQPPTHGDASATGFSDRHLDAFFAMDPTAKTRLDEMKWHLGRTRGRSPFFGGATWKIR
jgi:hypothetical protein